ncbi:hypothetical protein Plhal710r2_c051g0158461 [Plasmopara halstedii]
MPVSVDFSPTTESETSTRTSFHEHFRIPQSTIFQEKHLRLEQQRSYKLVL